MKQMNVKRLLAIVALFCSLQLMAQKYDEYAKQVRDEIWAWDMSEFKNYDVPDAYKNESAVILAMHDRVIASAQRRLRVNSSLAFKINKELLYENTHRRMVKINDKVSLEKYATLSFKEQEKVWGYMMDSKFKTIIGVRIIKPDGTIKTVDVKEESVEMTEGKKDKTGHKKLAVSDLQVGDIIDYFVRYEGHMDSQNIPPFDIVFADRYPIASYSVHCEADKRLTTEYRPINGAPDFIQNTNEDGDIVLDLKLTHIPKYNGYERWVSPRRSYPMIRMAIMDNTSKNIWKPQTAREKGLHKNVLPGTIMDDARSAYGDYNFMAYSVKNSKVPKMLKRYKKEHPQVSKEELAAYIYDLALYEMTFTSSRNMLRTLQFLLQKNGVDVKLAFVTSRFGARADELFHRYDVENFLLTNNEQQPLSALSYYSIPGEIDPDFEGETALTIANSKYKEAKKMNKGGMLTGQNGSYAVPVTTPEQNKANVNIDIRFTDDMLTLEMEHRNVLRGAQKSILQRHFYTIEKWHQEKRERLQLTQTLQEEMAEKRFSRKYINDYNEKVEEQRRELKDKFIADLNNYYDSDPKELLEYEVVHLGVTPANPNLIYRTKYLMEGLVQKAGNNYILNVGKLIGAQLKPDSDERNRSIDAYLQSARMFEYAVDVAIPDGYKVENIDALQLSKENMMGAFTASARLDGNTLKLTVTKCYKQSLIKTNEFPQLLEMLDAAVEFTSKSVVLVKK